MGCSVCLCSGSRVPAWRLLLQWWLRITQGILIEFLEGRGYFIGVLGVNSAENHHHPSEHVAQVRRSPRGIRGGLRCQPSRETPEDRLRHARDAKVSRECGSGVFGVQ